MRSAAAVDSPSCKILNDIYHQQITEGNLIPNIDMAWEEIAAFHCRRFNPAGRSRRPGRSITGTSSSTSTPKATRA